ncbi:MAG: hypothetical protein PUE49_01765 [Eggerthellales bacterium]|nr:hypothetical protein [Eggerthellales bacterium]
MNTENIISLMQAFDASSLASMEVEHEDLRLKMKKPSAVAQQVVVEAGAGTLAGAGMVPAALAGAGMVPAALAGAGVPVTAPAVPAAAAPVAPAAAEATAPAADAATEAAPAKNLVAVKAPLVGVFYAAPSPDQPPYVSVGDHVEEGATLCLVEAMKLFNEIPAPCSGTIAAIHAKNAEVVGFDELIMEIEVDA